MTLAGNQKLLGREVDYWLGELIEDLEELRARWSETGGLE